jgi:hypothetical protein
LAQRKTHRQIALAVGSGDAFKIALLHPIPSSRRHVIRVDIPVPVDVIRADFWMRVFMKMVGDTWNNYEVRVIGAPA